MIRGVPEVRVSRFEIQGSVIMDQEPGIFDLESERQDRMQDAGGLKRMMWNESERCKGK